MLFLCGGMLWGQYLLIYGSILLCFLFMLGVTGVTCHPTIEGTDYFSGVILVLCSASLAGVPPLTGFVLKWVVLSEAVKIGAVVYIIAGLIGIRTYFYIYLSMQGVLSRSG